MQNYDYSDPKINELLALVRPEVRQLFNDLVSKEGYEKGSYTFDQILAELVHRLGVVTTMDFLTKRR